MFWKFDLLLDNCFLASAEQHQFLWCLFIC